MRQRRRLLHIAGSTAIAAVAAGIAGRRLIGAPPELPALPTGWAEEVLTDVIAVDVERWRRASGAVVHASSWDRVRLVLTLDATGSTYEPRTLRSWWRSSTGTAVELLGTLSIAPEQPSGDAAEAGIEARVALTLVHRRDGRNAAQLELALFGSFFRSDSVWLEAVGSAPPSELLDETPQDDTPRSAGWQQFPRPLCADDTRAPARLTELDGADIELFGLADLCEEPAELLLDGRTPGPQSRSFRLRLTADGPIGYDYPEPDDPSDWNSANALDMDYRVDHWTLADDRLAMSGDDWSVEISGPGLQVQAEWLEATAAS